MTRSGAQDASMSVFGQLRLDGRVAVLTGASRGLGRAMAVALAEAGADLGLLATAARRRGEGSAS